MPSTPPPIVGFPAGHVPMSPIFRTMMTTVNGRTYHALADQIQWAPVADVPALIAAGWSDLTHITLAAPPRRA